MKLGDYTGIDDIETLFRMVHDDSLDTEKRVLAVIDLSLTDDFDSHRLLDFVLEKSQPSAIRGEVFDKQSWDERSIPVILQAFQEENDEIRFWATYALADKHYQWKRSQLDKIIFILDRLAQNEYIAPNMWHVGREALYPLERAYYRKIISDKFDPISFRLISLRLEYWDFMQARKKGNLIVEPTLELDPI